MAFLQTNPNVGGLFINIGQSVGRGKPNKQNDVLVIQAMLEIIYNNSTAHRKRRPGGRTVRVSSSLLQDTPKLIADFQRFDLKRSSPQGFCDQAPASNSNQINFNTLFRLWSLADGMQGLGDDLLTRFQKEHPSLRGLPQQTRATVIKSTEVRAPRHHDSSR